MKHLLYIACVLVVGCASPPEVPERPHVVVILVDDMGYSDLGSYGSEIQTPHLDALAQQGLQFTEFYNTAKCSPTRAALLTGHYAHTAGMGGNIASLRRPEPPPGPYQGYLSRRTPTLAEILKADGYSTYMVGKWHVGERPHHWPLRRGFERYFGLISGASSYYELITDQPRQRVMVYDSTRWNPPADGFYMTDAFADSAVAFVNAHAARPTDDPFFLYLAFTAPHWPLHAPAETIAQYEGRYLDGWEATHRARVARMQAEGLMPENLAGITRPASLPEWERLSAEDRAVWARRMQIHAAMVQRMDEGVGRLVEALRAHDALDNTLLFFLSDNGASAEDVTGRKLHDASVPNGAKGSYDAFREPWAWVSVAPLKRYKLNLEEGGIRTPLIVHWPDGMAASGSRTETPGHLIDLTATILDVTGTTYPLQSASGEATMPLPGASLRPLFTEPTTTFERTLFWEYNRHRAVRAGSMKALYRNDTQTWALYDLTADPTESTDLATLQRQQLDTLVARWQTWASSVGVRLDND